MTNWKSLLSLALLSICTLHLTAQGKKCNCPDFWNCESDEENTGPIWKVEPPVNMRSDHIIEYSPVNPQVPRLYAKISWDRQVYPAEGPPWGTDAEIYFSTNESSSGRIPGYSCAVPLAESEAQNERNGYVGCWNGISVQGLTLNTTYYIGADVSESFLRPQTEGNFIDFTLMSQIPSHEFSIAFNSSETDDSEPNGDITKVTVDVSLPAVHDQSWDEDDHALFLYASEDAAGNDRVAWSNVVYLNPIMTPYEGPVQFDLTPSVRISGEQSCYLFAGIFMGGSGQGAQYYERPLGTQIVLRQPTDTPFGFDYVWLEPSGFAENSLYNTVSDLHISEDEHFSSEVSECFNAIGVEVPFWRNSESFAFDAYSQMDGYGLRFATVTYRASSDLAHQDLCTQLGIDMNQASAWGYVLALDYVSLSWPGVDDTQYWFAYSWPTWVINGELAYFRSVVTLNMREMRKRVETSAYDPWRYSTRSSQRGNQLIDYVRGILAHEIGHMLDSRLEPSDETDEHSSHGNGGDPGRLECIMHNGAHYPITTEIDLEHYPNLTEAQGMVVNPTAGTRHKGLTSNPHFCKNHVQKWAR